MSGSALILSAAVLLGAVGVYLAMPGSRLSLGRAALVLLLGAGAIMVGSVTRMLEANQQVWFALFAALGLWGAVRVVTHRRPVYSALYFILVVVAVTGMLVMMHAEFLAAAVLTIYAGAILVTYVFVIMLAQQGGDSAYDAHAREPLWGCLTGFLLLAVIANSLMEPATGSAAGAIELPASAAGTVQNVGISLLTTYVVGIELTGVLLLAAMVGAIAIARRRAGEDTAGEVD